MDRRQFGKTLGAFVTALAAKDNFAKATVVGAKFESMAPSAPLATTEFIRSNLEQYNPVWSTPSNSAHDSMPLSGAQGTGLNVWVQDGAVYFYIGRNDAYDEDGNLLKLGCVRLRLDPNPLMAAKAFQQKLDIYTSRITIHARDEKGHGCEVLLWFDVRQPVVFVEVDCRQATFAEASFMTWRDEKRPYPSENWNFADHRNVDPALRKASVDHIEAQSDALLWYHQNDNASLIVEPMIGDQKMQGRAGDVVDPSRSLVFGGMLRGEGLAFVRQEPVLVQEWEGTSWIYRSRERGKKHSITVSMDVEQTADREGWKRKVLEASLRSFDPEARETASRHSAKWWAEFWERSYIFINAGKGPNDIGWQVSKNYQLFRYMLACNRGGSLPLKFNGGIFNIDTHREEGYRVIDGAQPPAAPPDDRRWSTLFMAQNQRLIGWPVLMSGDADLVTPSLDFYADRVKTAVARSQTYWNHGGAAFVEPLSLYGLPVQALATDHGPCSAKHLAWHFSIMIEFAWMALEWTSYSGQDVVKYLPLIEEVVRFYDEHYRQAYRQRTGNEYDTAGHLVLFPMNCLELYKDATDPIEVVCGLHRVVDGVLLLPPDRVPPSMRSYFEQLKPRLPEIQFEMRVGKKVLKPAKDYDATTPLNKTEFPEMYAVWPYRLFGVGSRYGNAEANNTWELLPAIRQPAMNFMSWQCTPIYAALMGRVADAKRLTIEKLADKNASLRFTAFFGPGHDWIPDHNWGGSAMVGLQSMLVAPADEGLCLLPAWPEDWDVDFQLHLPHQGLVRAQVRQGDIRRMTVTKTDGGPYSGRVFMPQGIASKV